MKQFGGDNCGLIDKYIGCTIKKHKSGGIKFLQKVLLQRYRDEFDIKNLNKFNTLATPGTVLKKPINRDVLLTPEKQTLYCSGVGKAMHMMQYSQPDTYNTVCDLAMLKECDPLVLVLVLMLVLVGRPSAGACGSKKWVLLAFLLSICLLRNYEHSIILE
jgi:hypothetical protein